MSSESQDAEKAKNVPFDTEEGRRLWLEEWKLHVQGARDSARVMRSNAYSYAQIGLNAAFLINGGALVAIPPLMQWLSSSQRQQIPVSAIYFVAGLLLAAACSLLTFASLMIGGWVLDANAGSAATSLAVRYGLKDESVLRARAYNELVTSKQRFLPWIRITSIAGIACCIAAYGVFLVGIFAFIQIVRT